MAAFRQQAKQCYPEVGGDPAIFRSLVEAKDRALALTGGSMTRHQRTHRGFHRLGLWFAIAGVVYLAAIFRIGIAVVNPFDAPWVWVIGAAIYAASWALGWIVAAFFD
jgi:hypothetical protein